MKKRLIPFCVAAALAVGACGGSGEKDAEGFPPAKALAADSVAIEQILSVQNMILREDYAAIYSPRSGKVIFRYRLPDWTFLDSSLVEGQGPDDVLRPSLLSTSDPGNELWLAQSARKKLDEYHPEEGGLVRTREVFGQEDSWLFNGTVCGDTLLLHVVMDFTTEKNYLLSTLLEGDSLRTVDSLLCFSRNDITSIPTKNGVMKRTLSYNYPEVFVMGDRVAVWYSGTRSLLVYRIGQDARLELEGSFGEPLTEEKVATFDFKGQQDDDNSPGRPLAVSSDHIYMCKVKYEDLEGEITPYNMPTPVGVEVKVYDWKLQPVRRFLLEKPTATQLRIDVARQLIYAYDPRVDFEQVYVYKYKL